MVVLFFYTYFLAKKSRYDLSGKAWPDPALIIDIDFRPCVESTPQFSIPSSYCSSGIYRPQSTCY